MFIVNSRLSRCGGTGVNMRSDLVVLDSSTVLLYGAEFISLRLAGADGKPLLITSLYRAPSADINKFLIDLNRYMASLSVRGTM